MDTDLEFSEFLPKMQESSLIYRMKSLKSEFTQNGHWIKN